MAATPPECLVMSGIENLLYSAPAAGAQGRPECIRARSGASPCFGSSFTPVLNRRRLVRA